MRGWSASGERTLLDFEALGFGDVLMLGRYAYACAHPPLLPHSHGAVYEVCILERGRQSYTVAGKPCHLIGGDILIVRPHEVHGTAGAPEERGVLYWLEFRVPGRLRSFLGLAADETERFIAAWQNLPRRKFRGGEGLHAGLERVFAVHADQGNPLRLIELRNLLLRLLLDILRLGCRPPFDTAEAPILRALEQIEENLGEELQLEPLALGVGLSPSHFKTAFRRVTGVPPAEYIARRRIEVACDRLACTDQPVTQLAFDLGFCSSQHFATVFKRFTGKTPGLYRKGVCGEPLAGPPPVGAGVGFHPVAGGGEGP